MVALTFFPGDLLTSGEKLQAIRARIGVSIRDVEEQSRRIAATKERAEYYISNSRLTQIENKNTIPSIYKLYSLAAILRVMLTDLLNLFGVELDGLAKHQIGNGASHTHLASVETPAETTRISFPVRFDPGFSGSATALLSRIVEVWGEIPVGLIRQLDIRRTQYGFIGLEDFTMFPMIRPGSFVQINHRCSIVQSAAARSEYERPIYFVELRNGYACGWCELSNKQLTLVPHPLSPCKLRHFAYGTEAEIVGRVTAVAMKVVDFESATVQST